jgi:hypothetical protein
VWRDGAGRYFLFPEGALPPACTAVRQAQGWYSTSSNEADM